MLLVIEDLHWADPRRCRCSRTWSGPWAGRRCSSPARCATEDPHGLHALLGDLRRERRLERVDLAGLSEDDVSRPGRRMARASRRRRELAAAVRRRTGGNPLFVEELVRHLVESRAGDLERGRDAPSVPPGVHAVIDRRLARLAGGRRARGRGRGGRGRGLRAGGRSPPSARRATTPSPRRSRRRSRAGLIDEGAVAGPLPLRARAGARVRAGRALGHPPRAAAPAPRERARGAAGAAAGRAGAAPARRAPAGRRRRTPRGRRCGRRSEATRRLAYEDAAELLERAGDELEGDAPAARRGPARARRRPAALRRRRLGRPLLRGRGRRGAGARRPASCSPARRSARRG